MSLAKYYLLAYNLVSCFGWLYVLYDSTWLALVQSLAILEVFHSAIGLVKSSFQTTVMQISSRLFIVFLLEAYHYESSFFSLMLVSWALTEIVRYSFYAFYLVGYTPFTLLYLRYTLFYVLYPTGAGSEIVMGTDFANFSLFEHFGSTKSNHQACLSSYNAHLHSWLLRNVFAHEKPTKKATGFGKEKIGLTDDKILFPNGRI
jgi:Protein tyrosine phosphatase-like protein, PTPLA